MNKKTPIYNLLDHTADLGVEITGSGLIDLFEKAGETLLHLIFITRPAESTDTKKISISGNDLPDLMVRWLTEILYLFEGENLVVTSITIDSLSSADLKATLTTAPFDPKVHEIIREIKAVTYHQIAVTDETGIWTARVIFDL
ncbi:archease [Deltaproteobacteria bacterium]|nr:archease [Deltaproteobacteria bacterium]